MVTVSAPGKVILFGEHAVVYGEPSLAGAIDRRTHVAVDKRSDGIISINSNMEPCHVSFSMSDLNCSVDAFPYVRKAIELTFERISEKSGLDIEISSKIPPASGLGSSSAVSVASILAIHKAMGHKISGTDLAKLGQKVELGVQGAASPTDTAIATFGGVLFIEPGKMSFQRIDASFTLVVGYTGIERSTKVLVEHVRALRDRFPEIVGSIIGDIGRITREAKRIIENGGDIGDLMNINHGLLVALGVSNSKLDNLVYAATDAGASGAKLTGAGGGGCMIAHAPGAQEAVTGALERYGVMAFDSAITSEGVRLE